MSHALTFNPEVRFTRINDRVESVYLVFRQGIRSKETIPFTRADGAELLIDVDDQDIPIAIQCIESQDSPIADDAGSSGSETEVIVSRLFAFVNQMVAYHRANQQARGNALIEEALTSVRGLAGLRELTGA